jgi:hypothetical protein
VSATFELELGKKESYPFTMEKLEASLKIGASTI